MFIIIQYFALYIEGEIPIRSETKEYNQSFDHEDTAICSVSINCALLVPTLAHQFCIVVCGIHIHTYELTLHNHLQPQ